MTKAIVRSCLLVVAAVSLACDGGADSDNTAVDGGALDGGSADGSSLDGSPPEDGSSPEDGSGSDSGSGDADAVAPDEEFPPGPGRPDPSYVPVDELDLDGRVEGLVELNYYVDEAAANVVFHLGPGPIAEGMDAEVELADQGVSATKEVTNTGPTFVELPLDGLQEGEYTVDLTLTADASSLWEGRDTLVKRPVPPPEARITQVDRYRRIMRVDGDPYFPVGIFGIFPEHLSEASERGFNVTKRWKGATTIDRYDRSQASDSTYNRQDVVRSYLDEIDEAGMFAVESPVKLAEESLYIHYNDQNWEEKYPIHNQEITPGVVENARDHSAVIGYYSYDEADNYYPDQPDHPEHLLMQEGVEQWYEIVHDQDPYHSVMSLFAVGLSKVEGWEAWEAAMRDFYIGDEEHMSRVYDVAVDSQKVAWRNHWPFVFTPLLETSDGRPVPMSPEEHRAQMYLSLVADVKGLFYWEWPAAYAPSWEMLDQLATEANALAPVLLERAPEQEITYADQSQRDSVKALVKNHKGRAYLIAVNAESAPVDVQFSLPEYFDGDTDVHFEDRNLTVTDGDFDDSFGPYDRHLYRLPEFWRPGDELELTVDVGNQVETPDPQFPSSSDNLLTNTSFEYDYGGLAGWPYEWGIADSVMDSGQVGQDDGRWTPVDDEAHHGDRSLRLIKTTPGLADSDGLFNLAEAPAAAQEVSFPSGGTYTFSAWLKAEEEVQLRVMAGWTQSASLDVGTDWERHEVTFDIDSAGDSFIRIYLLEQGTLWIDAVQLEEGDTAGQYVDVEPQ